MMPAGDMTTTYSLAGFLARDMARPERGDPLVRALRRIRYERNIPARVLAPRIGVTHESVRNWESGAKSPSLVSLQAWAGALGYDLTLTEKRAARLSSERPVE